MLNGTTIRFGWDSPLTVEEEEEEEGEVEVEQDFFPRYSNPWSQTEWGSKVIRWVKLHLFLFILLTKGSKPEATSWSWTWTQ